jgi:hypothetical protein
VVRVEGVVVVVGACKDKARDLKKNGSNEEKNLKAKAAKEQCSTRLYRIYA